MQWEKTAVKYAKINIYTININIYTSLGGILRSNKNILTG
jgi:hypothetical protein